MSFSRGPSCLGEEECGVSRNLQCERAFAWDRCFLLLVTGCLPGPAHVFSKSGASLRTPWTGHRSRVARENPSVATTYVKVSDGPSGVDPVTEEGVTGRGQRRTLGRCEWTDPGHRSGPGAGPRVAPMSWCSIRFIVLWSVLRPLG